MPTNFFSSSKTYPPTDVWLARAAVSQLGEAAAQRLFGTPVSKDGHLMPATNGIPMTYVFEEWFDEGRLVIVPEQGRYLEIV